MSAPRFETAVGATPWAEVEERARQAARDGGRKVRAKGFARGASACGALRVLPHSMTRGRVCLRVHHPSSAVVEGLQAGLWQSRAKIVCGSAGDCALVVAAASPHAELASCVVASS